VLDGEIRITNGVRTGVGGHSIASGKVRVLAGTEKLVPGAKGVDEAQVEIADAMSPSGWTEKGNRAGGMSTMFPDSWTADRIKVEVDFAYHNPTYVDKTGAVFGTTSSGIDVKIVPGRTAFPWYP
jgi:filamentous hemagglutinin